MSNGDKRIGSRCATGEVEGTGSDLRLVCGFRPAVVMIHNVDGEAILFWNKSLPDTYGWKQLGVSSGTNAAEAAHTHAVALDSGSSAAVSHTHADSLAVNSGTVTVTPNAVTAGTPAGTNAVSNVTSQWVSDLQVVQPAWTLTHAADPSAGGDTGLFVIEALAGGIGNCGSLTSTCASNANVLGETADGSVLGTAASVRFFVLDDDSPAGVQVYVNEGSSDQLECISPTAADVFLILPMENTTGLGIVYAKIRIHHAAGAAAGKALYFDDNGAAGAQLRFLDAGAAGGVIPAADVEMMQSSATATVSGLLGQAAAQTFSGSELGTHQHADTAVLADVTLSGEVTAEAAHVHGPGSLADAASAAGSSHNHVFTGGAGENALITSLGITPYFDGFNIGADTDVNVSAETIYWSAWRY